MKPSKLETLLSSIPEPAREAIAQFNPTLEKGNIFQVDAPTLVDVRRMSEATVWVWPLLKEHGFGGLHMTVNGKHHGSFNAEEAIVFYEMHCCSVAKSLSKKL